MILIFKLCKLDHATVVLLKPIDIVNRITLSTTLLLSAILAFTLPTKASENISYTGDSHNETSEPAARTPSEATNEIASTADLALREVYQNCDADQISFPGNDLGYLDAKGEVIGATLLNGTRPQRTKPPRDLSADDLKYLQSHPYLKNLCTVRNDKYIPSSDVPAKCDPCLGPPSYEYGKGLRPHIPTSLYDLESQPQKSFQLSIVPGSPPDMDCSAFVSQVLRRSGRKLFKKQAEFAQFSTTVSQTMTEQLVALGSPSNESSCIRDIPLSQSESVKAGDIIAWNGHTVIVTAVGPDPLGIKDIPTLADCKKINSSIIKKFDFEIAQSGTYWNSQTNKNQKIGISKTSASRYFYIHSGKTIMRPLFTQLAKKACEQKFSDESVYGV